VRQGDVKASHSGGRLEQEDGNGRQKKRTNQEKGGSGVRARKTPSNLGMESPGNTLKECAEDGSYGKNWSAFTPGDLAKRDEYNRAGTGIANSCGGGWGGGGGGGGCCVCKRKLDSSPSKT